VTEPGGPAARFSPRTVWTQNLQTPLRRFLRTETGSGGGPAGRHPGGAGLGQHRPVGVCGDVAYRVLLIRSGTRGLADSWQGWVNSGLMAFFFLVAGLRRAASSTWASCASGGGWRCPWWSRWAG